MCVPAVLGWRPLLALSLTSSGRGGAPTTARTSTLLDTKDLLELGGPDGESLSSNGRGRGIYIKGHSCFLYYLDKPSAATPTWQNQ